MTTLIDIIRSAQQSGVSDIHVSIGSRPGLRLHSRLEASTFDIVTPAMMEAFITEIIPPAQLEQFRRERELDFSIGRVDTGRLRINAYFQRNSAAFAIRILPTQRRTFAELGLPIGLMKQLAGSSTGLMLLTGPTGTGKTTTLASIVDFIAETRDCHIVTVEDPIEYVFANKKATIHQREVGSDTLSFARALKYVLRQDPDVIVIGEMRDEETMAAALTAAETGHFVIATLHTPDAIQTINRIIDVFPEQKHPQVRTQLSFALRGVISQRLLPLANGKGRILAAEILLATPAVRSIIRENKVHQLYSTMQTSSKEGMKTMNQGLAELVVSKQVSVREATQSVTNLEEFERAIALSQLQPAEGNQHRSSATNVAAGGRSSRPNQGALARGD